MFKSTPVSFEEVFPGMIVKSNYFGYVGAIINCDAIDNVIVKYDPQGYRFVCLDPNSKRYEKLYEEKIDVENEVIKCECGETLYMFRDYAVCKCNNVINR